jgi:hypothetical protein
VAAWTVGLGPRADRVQVRRGRPNLSASDLNRLPGADETLIEALVRLAGLYFLLQTFALGEVATSDS